MNPEQVHVIGRAGHHRYGRAGRCLGRSSRGEHPVDFPRATGNVGIPPGRIDGAVGMNPEQVHVIGRSGHHRHGVTGPGHARSSRGKHAVRVPRATRNACVPPGRIDRAVGMDPKQIHVIGRAGYHRHRSSDCLTGRSSGENTRRKPRATRNARIPPGRIDRAARMNPEQIHMVGIACNAEFVSVLQVGY